ncbi:MAG: aminotransferase class V-fold PLP-dependent enzyme [Candidatus Nanoarchaeia archaeon]
MKDYKKDFPILKKTIYLDNAATTQKPSQVIERIKKFYEEENASTHSGTYVLSENATAMLDEARKIFAELINSEEEEIIFTRNATDSLNMLAEIFRDKAEKNTNIVTTEIEHHSNFIPWQQLAQKQNAALKIAKYDIEKEEIKPAELVDRNTIIASFTVMSNVTGLFTDAEKIIKEIRAKNKNTIIILDATQAVPHAFIDVKKLDADFICFSAHKMYGPAGVGILFGKKELLNKINPSRYGGSMMHSVTKEKSTWAESPHRFEPGTNNAEGIICAAEAVKYMKKENLKELFKKEEELKKYAVQEMKKIKGLEILGHKKSKHGPVISFTIKNIHPHDVATICAQKNVCVRAGHHCAQPFHDALGIGASTRISLSFYNDRKDIDACINALKQAIKTLG